MANMLVVDRDHDTQIRPTFSMFGGKRRVLPFARTLARNLLLVMRWGRPESIPFA